MNRLFDNFIAAAALLTANTAPALATDTTSNPSVVNNGAPTTIVADNSSDGTPDIAINTSMTIGTGITGQIDTDTIRIEEGAIVTFSGIVYPGVQIFADSADQVIDESFLSNFIVTPNGDDGVKLTAIIDDVNASKLMNSLSANIFEKKRSTPFVEYSSELGKFVEDWSNQIEVVPFIDESRLADEGVSPEEYLGLPVNVLYSDDLQEGEWKLSSYFTINAELLALMSPTYAEENPDITPKGLSRDGKSGMLYRQGDTGFYRFSLRL